MKGLMQDGPLVLTNFFDRAERGIDVQEAAVLFWYELARFEI